MWLVIEDHDNLFVMSELVHFLGIALLAWKLVKKKNAGGALLTHRRFSGLPSRRRDARCWSVAVDISSI